MADNPYKGQEGYERAWSDGFDRGHHSPHEDQPAAPTVFPPWDLDQQMLSYFQQVWLEGHLAGRQTPIAPNVQHHEQDGHNPISTAGHVFEGVSVVKSIAARHFAVAAVELFLAVMVPSGAPRWTEEEGDLHAWFAAACSEYSWNEFFLPVVWGQSDEAPGWHGNAYTSFDSAKQEADPYLQQGSPIHIAHYRCDTPSMMEVIELGYQ
jgi:hypothetical protein